MSTATHNCVYLNCGNDGVDRPYLSLFKFPKDERQRVWIENSGNANLYALNSKQILSRSLCELHFASKYINNHPYRKVLVNHAIPLHYIKGDTSGTPKKKMVTHTCVYLNCQTNSTHRPILSLFTFPKEEERRRVWIQNSGNVNLYDLNLKQILSMSICELHFASKYVTINPYRKILVNHAIPLHYIKGDTTITSTTNKTTTSSSIITETNSSSCHDSKCNFKIISRIESPLQNDFADQNDNFTISNIIPVCSSRLAALSTTPPDLSVLPVKNVYSNKKSSKYTEHLFELSSDHFEEETDLITSTEFWPLEESNSQETLECESAAEDGHENSNLHCQVNNNTSMPRSTITQEIVQRKEFTNVPKQRNINMQLPVIKQEIVNLPRRSMSPENRLEPICFVSTTENINEHLPDLTIKQEAIQSEEFTNVPQRGNINMPLAIIKQEIVTLPEPSASSESRLEPMCIVSTTERINEDVYENLSNPVEEDIIPQGEDQYDIFGKLVASELRCVKSEALLKKMKLRILNILMDTTE